MPKTILRPHYSCSVQKTGGKITKYLRKEAILKIGRLQKALAYEEVTGSKIKFAENMQKTILQPHLSCSIKKKLEKTVITRKTRRI